LSGAYVNTPVSASPTLDPNSGSMISMLAGAVGSSSIWTNGLAASGGQWSATVYHANNATPTRKVTLAVPLNGSYSISVPYQSGWLPTVDSDHHLVVINDDSGAYVEFQGLDLSTSTAHGAATGNVYSGDATNTPSNHVSGLPELAGLITAKDIASGTIRHALRCAVPTTAPSYRWPATVTDGSHAGGLPMGAHLWLPRDVSLSGLSSAQQILAKAFQDYGCYVSDTSGAFVLYAQSTTDGSAYPFSSLSLPNSLIAQLKVLH
jgi:hypothetical protein